MHFVNSFHHLVMPRSRDEGFSYDKAEMGESSDICPGPCCSSLTWSQVCSANREGGPFYMEGKFDMRSRIPRGRGGRFFGEGE